MQAVLQFIDKLPFITLVVVAVMMGMAPFFPEPHLMEKARWMMTGHPFKLIDVFDVFWHLLPLALVAAKVARGSTSG